jgi:hypothetical protein
MAERLGYAHDRWFWLMGPRARRRAARAGVAARRHRARVSTAARQCSPTGTRPTTTRSPGTTVRAEPDRETRASARGSRASARNGLLLALPQRQVAGYCRGELHATRGEDRLARHRAYPATGFGLGRALLRWGVQWLNRRVHASGHLLVGRRRTRARSPSTAPRVSSRSRHAPALARGRCGPRERGSTTRRNPWGPPRRRPPAMVRFGSWCLASQDAVLFGPW